MKFKDLLLIALLLLSVGLSLYVAYAPAPKVETRIDYDHEKKIKDSVVSLMDKKIDSFNLVISNQEKITGIWIKNYQSLENVTNKYNEKYGRNFTDSAFFVVLDSLRATGLGKFKP